MGPARFHCAKRACRSWSHGEIESRWQGG